MKPWDATQQGARSAKAVNWEGGGLGAWATGRARPATSGGAEWRRGVCSGGAVGTAGTGPPPTLGWDKKTAQGVQEDVF